MQMPLAGSSTSADEKNITVMSTLSEVDECTRTLKSPIIDYRATSKVDFKDVRIELR